MLTKLESPHAKGMSYIHCELQQMGGVRYKFVGGAVLLDGMTDRDIDSLCYIGCAYRAPVTDWDREMMI